MPREMRRVTAIWRKLWRRGERDALVPLYINVVAAARQPVWYAQGQVPDTIEGRFDMVAAILALVLLKLEAEGDAGQAPAARLTELFVEDMDGQLRQQGIGDIIVGKHIGRLMGQLGGRLGALRGAFAEGEALDEVIARNIYRGERPADAALAVTAQGLAAMRAALAATSLGEMLDGGWPA